MKKIISLIICFCLLFLLCSCGSDTEENQDKNSSKATNDVIPNSFYAYDNGLLLQVDYADYHNFPAALYNPQDALYYKNGELHKLEASTAKITLDSNITSNGTDIILPIKYYVYEDTVRAYLGADRTELPMSAFFKGIKGNDSSVIIYDAAVKYPIIYSLKDNTYKPLYDGFSFKGYIDCISDDGRYIMVAEIDKAANSVKYSVLDLTSGETFNITLPQGEKGYKLTPTPYCFIGDTLILKINFATYLQGENYISQDKIYEFNIRNEVLTEFAKVENFENYNKQWDFVFANADTLKGEFSVYNFNTDKKYCFDVAQPALFDLNVNETGEYAFGSYAFYDTDAIEYDNEGNPVFLTPSQNDYIKVFLDFKNNREIDIDKHLKYNEKNKDMHKKYQWISDTALLVTYVGKASENQQFINEIIDVMDVLNEK